jgi:1-acyl-sn-glycerol-3-phosphate acyltransferase
VRTVRGCQGGVTATLAEPVSPLIDAVGGAIRGPLTLLEHRAAAAHRRWVSQRDPEFIRRQLPTIDLLLRYFAPEVRHAERVPAEGPALIVGNHSGIIYMPDMWAVGLAVVRRRGVESPVFGLGYDLLFAIPGVESVIRRLGAVPAGGEAAEEALRSGGAVVVYPGGDWEACRPWTDRNKVDFAGHKGFVRLALRAGVPIVPVVSHGAHHSVVVLTRGEGVARALGLSRVKVHVMPILVGVPFGVAPVLMPPLPMPTKVTVDFLDPLDWSGDGPEAADDETTVQARYDEITGLLQEGLDRLSSERPHPLISRFSRPRPIAAVAPHAGARHGVETGT